MRLSLLNKERSSIAVIGSYVPRRCGIATYSADLVDSLKMNEPDLSVHVYAMNEQDLTYPSEVAKTIDTHDISSYCDAIRAINRGDYGVLSLQHEYGIFGGSSGEYILSLLGDVKVPIVSTLHTVLQEPSPEQRAVLDEVLSLSSRVVVMSHRAIDILHENHGVRRDKIDYIPHGIPQIPSEAGFALRDSMNGAGPILLTFGLLSPDKGIENVIEAMPGLLKLLPETKYIVAGATHPNVIAQQGEIYRHNLQALAIALGVEDSVIFIDRYLSIEELKECLSAADFYITPYLNPVQITSGTLAYSLGAGSVVISTPYEYAKEVLSNERGVLVPFRDPNAIAEAVLLNWTNPKDYDRISTNALRFASTMYWDRVGRLYLQSFARARRQDQIPHIERVRSLSLPLPTTVLRHLTALTDDTGVLQHALFSVPNRSEGYCTDDNARALLLTVVIEEGEALSEHVQSLQSRYLSFVASSFDPEAKVFRNFMSYGREWLDWGGSDDSQGRALWALGYVAGHTRHFGHAHLAANLFEQAAPSMSVLTSPRAWAYVVLGTVAFLNANPDSVVAANLLEEMSNRLYSLVTENRGTDWPWPEERLAYANARIPQALLEAGEFLERSDYVREGLSLLSWLLENQISKFGCFSPVGCEGAGPIELSAISFDQQPIEACSTVSAALSAFRITNDHEFLDDAHWCFDWFLGRNVNGIPVAIPGEGSCCDGLSAEGVNENQGAESTISYLTALSELQLATLHDRIVTG